MNDIACIVVTYNRLNLLRKCYKSLLEQSFQKFDIVVVDNGSTDGTSQWLDSIDSLNVIHQKNLGGAGGFYTGMKYAFEKGYKWFWLMDDDGVPDVKQLENLLVMGKKETFIFMNSLVCDIVNPAFLAFGLSTSIKRCEDIRNREYIEGMINPFNGTFIHRKVIDLIGFIKKEMFIWGDEVEYTLRAKQAGIEVYTICNAIHYHPHNKGKMEPVLPYIMNKRIIIKPKSLSLNYYRNLGFIQSRYFPVWKQIVTVVEYMLFWFLRLDFNEAWKFVKFYFRGYFNKYEV